MKMIQDIIVAPIVTENSMEAMQHKKYTFKVMKSANKVEIAKAVEAMFPGTKVAAVNTMNSFKKAIVTLTEDSKTIEFFESMR